MRNVSKNKFLLCFCPEVNTDAMLDSKASVDRTNSSRRFSCIPIADKHDTKSSDTKSVFSDQGCQKFKEEDWVEVMPHPKKRTLHRVIKALVFQNILNTRARNKNHDNQDCFGSKRSYSSYAETCSTGDDKSMFTQGSQDTNVQETNKAAELCSPISESKSLLSNSKYKKRESKDGDQLEKQKIFECSGVYLFVMSLALTVLLGRIYGIIWMSIWLFFFSFWKIMNRQPKEVAKLRKKESKAAYKNNNRSHYGKSGRYSKGTTIKGIKSLT